MNHPPGRGRVPHNKVSNDGALPGVSSNKSSGWRTSWIQEY
jgi:hypothetical protein